VRFRPFNSCRSRRRHSAIAVAVALLASPASPVAGANFETCNTLRDEIISEGLGTELRAATFAKSLRAIAQRFGKIALIGPYEEERSAAEVLAAEQLADVDFRFHAPISVSMGGHDFYQVDLDGDGRDDLVIDGIGGTLNCHRYNVFLRGEDGKLTPVRGPDFRGFEDEGSVCVGSGVKVELIRLGASVFFALLDEERDARSIFLFAITRKGASDFKCRVKFDGRDAAVVDEERPPIPELFRNDP